jgi:aminomethyltransferase
MNTTPCRKSAGVFDVSHMGEFILKGDKALDLIQAGHIK